MGKHDRKTLKIPKVEPTTKKRKIAVVGCCGRMGREVTRSVLESEDMELVAALEAPGHALAGEDVGLLAASGKCGVFVCCELENGLAEADAAVDFSAPPALVALLEACAAQKCALVTGTTGLAPRALAAMDTAIEKIPLVAAPNMSVGMNLLFALTEKAAHALGPDYDTEIIELHHRHKKDAPSGTAIRLAEMVAAARGADLKKVGRFSRHGEATRQHGEIGLMAVRAGDIVGEHTVLFAGPNERLELTHRIASRANFARGALQAARWVLRQPPGKYDMQDVLGLR
jgi:4-hydroxy-tetrahydrodipicolinate reductase